jgi:hypothetical protein
VTFPTTVFFAVAKDRDGKPRGFEKALCEFRLDQFGMEQYIRDRLPYELQASFVVIECVVMLAEDYKLLVTAAEETK